MSLISTFSKVFEKLVHTRLLNHLNKNSTLISAQYGFRENHSTSHAILKLLAEVTRHFENREPAVGVFCDLSKAFDRVHHNILCDKLEAYGVRGVPLDWFRSYLSDRYQFVQITGSRSDLLKSRFGVPQGSILGPLLFIVYVNDIVDHIHTASPTLYADDTTLLFGGPQLGLENRISDSIISLQSWLSSNNLLFNSEKSFVVQFLPHNKQPLSLSLSQLGIKESSSVSFLGLTLDQHLSWAEHINKLCSRLSKASFALRTLSSLLSQNLMIMVYHGCFSSIMAYGVEAWGGSTHSTRVFIRQKTAVRIIMNMPSLASCRGQFRALKILTLPSLYIFKTIIYVYKNRNIFQTVGSQHRYSTRHGEDLLTPQHRLTFTEREASCAGILFYNKLPKSLKICNKRCFERVLKDFLINNEFYNFKEFYDFCVNN